MQEYSLFDARGRRKYLVPVERKRFLKAALECRGRVATFCAVLTLTGARISEVLALTPERIDLGNCAINFETLKRRKRGLTRAVPVPDELMAYLEAVHRINDAQLDPKKSDKRLWTWSRATAWRRVVAVMKLAAIPSYVSQPKSLRHAFGVEAALEGVVITMIRDWLGHADMRTTMIYTTVIGPEARTLAERTWQQLTELF
ncbi:MAG TPA: site-specific integrase [Rhizomicrobium sp.]